MSTSAHYPVEPPAVGDALQLVLARVLEREARPCDEVPDSARDEHLAWTGERSDARADRDGEPTHVVGEGLDLARVQPGPDLDPERLHRLRDHRRAPDRPGRPVEGGQEPVAHRLDL